MCEVVREYNLDDFKEDVKKILDNEPNNQDALIKIMDANKRLNQGFIKTQYKQDCEIELLKRIMNTDKKRVQSIQFILDGYGGNEI